MLKLNDICRLNCQCHLKWRYGAVNKTGVCVQIVRRRNILSNQFRNIRKYIGGGRVEDIVLSNALYSVQYIDRPRDQYQVQTSAHREECLTVIAVLTEEDKENGIEEFE